MRRFLTIVFALLAAALPMGARPAGGGEFGPVAAEVAARVLSKEAEPGKVVSVEVKLTPSPGVHLYRDRVKPELVNSPGLTLGKFELPAGKKVKDEVLGEENEYYFDAVTFTVPVNVPADAKGEKINFTLRVNFQGCTDATCFPPGRQDVRLEVPVAAGAPVAPAPPEKTPPAAPPSSATQSTAPASAEAAKHSAIVTILLAFLAGLGVCLTPCVYPMIPVTVALIGGAAVGKDGVKSKWTILGYTLVYILGIALMYSSLGVVAALAGQSFGGWVGHPAVQIGIGVVMLVLAMSMFGVFDLTLGGSLASRIGVKGSGASLPVLLVSGALVGLVASPCASGPLIGLLTVIGKEGRVVTGALSLFAFAWGMSTLLLVAGLFPGFLARPGEWMNRVKLAFGVILAVMALYFTKEILPLGLFGVVGVAVALVLGVLLLVASRWLTDGTRTRALVAGLGFVGLVAAAYFGLGFAVRTGALLHAAESALPVRVAALEPNRGRVELDWKPYTPEAFEQARAAGKPVVIDFYATWCTLCVKLDRELFADREVASALRDFTLLRVDGSDTGSPVALAAARRFEGNYPTVIIIDRQGREVARFLGDAKPGPFLEKLKAAR